MKNWEPRSYPIRDPRKPTKDVGRVVNPPRAQKMGGKGESSIIRVPSTPLKVTKKGG